MSKMNHDLLMYELLYYKPSSNSVPTENNNTSYSIKQILDHFNPLVQNYTEDNEWIINHNSTLNFAVPDGKIVISNTVSNLNAHNETLITNMDLIKQYIKRMHKLSSLKYKIIEDSKYDVTWILWILCSEKD